jgi:hypothetical protein
MNEAQPWRTFFVAESRVMIITGVKRESLDRRVSRGNNHVSKSTPPSLESEQDTGTVPLREQPRTTKETHSVIFPPVDYRQVNPSDRESWLNGSKSRCS